MSETNRALPGSTPSGSDDIVRPDSPTLGSPELLREVPVPRAERPRRSGNDAHDSAAAHRAAQVWAVEEAYLRNPPQVDSPYFNNWLHELQPGSPDPRLPLYPSDFSDDDWARLLRNLDFPNNNSNFSFGGAPTTTGGAVNPAPAMPDLGSRLMAHSQGALNIPPPLAPAVDSGIRRESLTAPLADQRGDDPTRLAPLLQIPRYIDPMGGSMADLTAHICCLLWFLSEEQVTAIENGATSWSDIVPSVSTQLVKAGIAFTRWVAQMLTTTQISQNVTFLALHLIYKLRVMMDLEARTGSEYRLMIIAWMLGNKFLDDSTYTNRTWAEVSGFDVAEINDMEQEFLAAIRYSLFPGESQWKTWLGKVRKFWNFSRNVEPLIVFAAPEIPSGKAPGELPFSTASNTPPANMASGSSNVPPTQSNQGTNAPPAADNAPVSQANLPAAQSSSVNNNRGLSTSRETSNANQQCPTVGRLPASVLQRRPRLSPSPPVEDDDDYDVAIVEPITREQIARKRARLDRPSEFWSTETPADRHHRFTMGLPSDAVRSSGNFALVQAPARLNPTGSDADAMFPARAPPPLYSSAPPPYYSAQLPPNHLSVLPEMRGAAQGTRASSFAINLPSVNAQGQISGFPQLGTPNDPRAGLYQPSWLNPGARNMYSLSQWPQVNFSGPAQTGSAPFVFGQRPASSSRPIGSSVYSNPAWLPGNVSDGYGAPPPAYNTLPHPPPPSRASTESLRGRAYPGLRLTDSVPQDMQRNPVARVPGPTSLQYYNLGNAQQGPQQGPVPVYNTVPGYPQPRPPPPGPPPPPPRDQ